MSFSDRRDGGKGRGVEGKHSPRGAIGAEIFKVARLPVDNQCKRHPHPFFNCQYTPAEGTYVAVFYVCSQTSLQYLNLKHLFSVISTYLLTYVHRQRMQSHVPEQNDEGGLKCLEVVVAMYHCFTVQSYFTENLQ